MDYKEYYNQLSEFSNKLSGIRINSKIYPAITFTGIIGMIQSIFIQKRKSNVISLTICDGKNYIECLNHILDLTEKVCNAFSSLPEEDKSISEVNSIVAISYKALNNWQNICPEIANTEMVRYNDFQMNISNAAERQLVDTLKIISPNLRVKCPYKGKKKRNGCLTDLTELGLKLLSLILTLAIVMLILGLIAGIIDLFN